MFSLECDALEQQVEVHLQNSQNRDAKATHLKLDELIRAVKEARTELVDLEDLSDEDLKKLQEEFARLRERAPA
ncbi:MAG TPA: low affinity iron permease family protein [Roseiflexaceae bacterium]